MSFPAKQTLNYLKSIHKTRKLLTVKLMVIFYFAHLEITCRTLLKQVSSLI
jgi:hypothetical protein